MWFQQIVRTFFYSLDNVLFNFIPTVYDLLISISRTSILSQGQIKQFADRIELFLGIFMLFKVSFSLITYILNPDEFSDKSKGFGKLWMNIIVSLIMLVIVPYIFNMAYQLQAMLLEENTLAIIILGETEDNANANYINTAGDKMAYTVMLPFFLPNYAYPGLNSCVNLTTSSGEANEECFQAMYDIFDGEKDSEGKNHSIEDYKYGILNQSLGLTFRLDTAKITVNGKQDFLIDYKFFISTAVAIVVLLLLISFCLDVALRSVKLSFLQLIYPIPVISYIDPKSGKDGLFKKWYEMCFKTYISLFVRLVALYFGIYIISKVNHLTDIINGSRVDNFAVKVFINIGVLFFIKQLPKILEGLGIKLDGDAKFQLNPFKKFEEGAIGGKRITGAIGGMAAGLIGGHGVGGRIAGMFGGAARGFAVNKGYKGGRERQAEVNRKMRLARINGAGFIGQRAAVLSNRYGLDDYDLEKEATQLRKDKRNIELKSREVEENNKNIERQRKEVEAKIAPKQSIITQNEKVKQSIEQMETYTKNLIENNKAGLYSDTYSRFKQDYESMKDREGKSLLHDYVDAAGVFHYKGEKVSQDMIIDAQNRVGEYLNRSGKKALMDDLLKGSLAKINTQAQNDFDAIRSTYQNEVKILNGMDSSSVKEKNSYNDLHNDISFINNDVIAKKNAIRNDEISIENYNRQIKENQANATVVINGSSKSLEEAQIDVNNREKALKDKQDIRKLNRDTARDRRIGGQ